MDKSTKGGRSSRAHIRRQSNAGPDGIREVVSATESDDEVQETQKDSQPPFHSIGNGRQVGSGSVRITART